jgi:hypothetical protein
MKIVDLNPLYISLCDDDTAFAHYMPGNKALFEHYRKFWKGGDVLVPSLDIDSVDARRKRILRGIADATELLEMRGFSTEAITAVLFVGNHTANGHAFLDHGKPIAWFAMECFDSRLEAKIFTMHELIHAVHYAICPEFAFDTTEQQHNISRQLITEGVATYLTKRLWNTTDDVALWADRLSRKRLHSWMDTCRNSERELFQYIAANFESSDSTIKIFHSADPEDIYSYRAGYYAGLKVIESIASKYDFSERDLLNIPLQEMKRLVWDELQSLISK